MIETLHHDSHFRVEREARDRLYRVARSSAPFADLVDCVRAHQAVDDALLKVEKDAKLLLDVRDAVPRNDVGFELVVAGVRDRIFSRFAKVAVLVRTPQGLEQVQRLNKGAAWHVAEFVDEDRAFDYLLG